MKTELGDKVLITRSYHYDIVKGVGLDFGYIILDTDWEELDSEYGFSSEFDAEVAARRALAEILED